MAVVDLAASGHRPRPFVRFGGTARAGTRERSGCLRSRAAMADDELEALRRITKRRQRAEGEWRTKIRRLVRGWSQYRGDRCGGVCFVTTLCSRS